MNKEFKLKVKGIKGDTGLQGEQGIQGIPGLNGKDGLNGRDGKDGINGKDGKNGIDADETVIADEVVNTLESKLTQFGEQFRDGLELLQGADRLDKKAIIGLEDYDEVLRLAKEPKGFGGGSRNLYQLQDVVTQGATDGQVLTKQGNQYVFTTISTSTPTLQQVTDEGNTTTNSITVAELVSFGDISIPSNYKIQLSNDNDPFNWITYDDSDNYGLGRASTIFGSIGNNFAFIDGEDSTVSMVITPTGVGIGTGLPTQKLEVIGNVRVQDSIFMGSSLYMYDVNAGGYGYMYHDDYTFYLYDLDDNLAGLTVSSLFATTVLNSPSIQASTQMSSPVYYASVNGSATNPVFSRLTDLNTGMFFPAVDTIAFSTNGVERVRINSAGNISLTQTVTTESVTSNRTVTIVINGTTYKLLAKA